jgi:hypothetical protein
MADAVRIPAAAHEPRGNPRKRTDDRDAGIVDLRTADARRLEGRTESAPVAVDLSKRDERRRLQPRIDLVRPCGSHPVHQLLNGRLPSCRTCGYNVITWLREHASCASATREAFGSRRACSKRRNSPRRWNSTQNRAASWYDRHAGREMAGRRPRRRCDLAVTTGFSTSPPRHGLTWRTGRGDCCPAGAAGRNPPCATGSDPGQRDQEDAPVRGRVPGRTQPTPPYGARCADDDWRTGLPVADRVPVSTALRFRGTGSITNSGSRASRPTPRAADSSDHGSGIRRAPRDVRPVAGPG